MEDQFPGVLGQFVAVPTYVVKMFSIFGVLVLFGAILVL